MKSIVSDNYLQCFRQLPKRVQRTASKNYRLWKTNPSHPSLDFKRVGMRSPVYSVRIGQGWRALGLMDEDEITWFWIGSHAEYDRLLQQVQMAKLVLDLHDIFNKGGQIEAALNDIMRQAVDKKIVLVEIIPGKGSGVLKERVLKYLQQKAVKALYHRVQKDSKNFGHQFVHFRF